MFPVSGNWTKYSENAVRDSRNVNGRRDLTATREAEFAKIGQGMQEWQRKRYSLTIAMTEVRDAYLRDKGEGMSQLSAALVLRG